MRILRSYLMALAAALAFPVLAHEGHDHGDKPVSAVSAAHSAAALPRAEAASELFELLMLAEPEEKGGQRLTLFLDHFTSNVPVRGAVIEIESPGGRSTATGGDQGIYQAEASWLKAGAAHDLTVTVRAGEDTDLLPLRLDLASVSLPADRVEWAFFWRWSAGALLAGILAWVLLKRPFHAAPRVVLFGLAAFGMLGDPQLGLAHEGHQHEEAPPAAVSGAQSPPLRGEAPQRRPDGSLFIPKPSQRALGLRTAVAEAGQFARAWELAGKVTMDPAVGGRVQAAFAGRLLAGAQGLPVLGQQVRKGEILAWLAPVAAGVDRGAARGQVAEAASQIKVLEKRVARYRELSHFIAKRDLEQAEFELAGARQRKAAVAAGVDGREALVAPVSGHIARSGPVAGQVVDAREILFEIVDPQRLAVEAMAYDFAAAKGIASAQGLGPSGETLALTVLGVGRALNEQALPVLFRIQGESALPLGAPVKVLARGTETVAGVRVPRAALNQAANGEARLWVHEKAEIFAPRRVEVQPLDASDMLVTAGLKGGERVLVEGVTAVGQIR